jgi:hypothetical protein
MYLHPHQRGNLLGGCFEHAYGFENQKGRSQNNRALYCTYGRRQRKTINLYFRHVNRPTMTKISRIL